MQGENERQWNVRSEREHVRHFLHKKSFWKFCVVVVQNNGKEMYKKVCCTCKVAFLLIRPIVVFHRSLALPSPLSITRFYILFEQTINSIETLYIIWFYVFIFLFTDWRQKGKSKSINLKKQYLEAIALIDWIKMITMQQTSLPFDFLFFWPSISNKRPKSMLQTCRILSFSLILVTSVL